jgi:hypothetical protein
MQSIDAICADDDGLKWFNWLYLQVTQAVENRVSLGGFSDPTWLGALDVQFAGLYFSALQNSLTDAPCPGRWGALFAVRDQARTARIQFALAGMNAHINHDLRMAVIATCRAGSNTPQHDTPQYDEEARETGLGGIGLGSSIEKRAVQLHHGTILAENAFPGLQVHIKIPCIVSQSDEDKSWRQSSECC